MKKSVLLLGLVFALFSCNSGNKESSSSASDEDSDKVSVNSSAKTYRCLEEFQDNYEKLLTKEEMAQIYQIDFDSAEVDLSSGTYGKYEYSWPSDRPDLEYEMSGMKIKGADKNLMGVSMLSFNSDKSDMNANKDHFDMGYKELSNDELKKIEENLSKQSDEVQKTGKDMMKVRAKRSWEFVDGTGSSAWYKWDDRYGGEMVVLAGKAKFTVKVKVSDDPSQNKGLAMKLAEMVMQKCH